MKPYLSLVIPCYNETQHLEKSFKKLTGTLYKNRVVFELIFVEDASRDNTLQLIRKLMNGNKKIPTSLIIHTSNKGRGKAVTDGIKKSRGDLVGFIDIDLEIAPKYIMPAIKLLKKHDMVVGKRTYPFSIISTHRFLASKIYAMIARRMAAPAAACPR